MTQVPKSGPTDDTAARRALHERIAGKWISQAIAVGAELGIPDILKDGPCSVAEIANAAGASEDAVRRLLRALASVSILSSEPDGRFALTASGSYLRSDVPGSLRGWARFVGHAVTWRPWGELAYSVRTGKPAFDHVFGSPIFDYFSRHPDAAAVGNQAMTSTSAIDADAVVQAYDFSGIRTLVDVGGGQGLLLAAILKANPHMRGILFELPHVIGGAAAVLKREGVTDRCELVSGDFFHSVPAGGDAYLLKLVIHDWDDDRAVQILRNCHQVMRPRTPLLLVDHVLRPGDEPDFGKFVDLEMLVLTTGGRERFEQEFRDLFEKAGFKLTQITRTASPKSVIEGIRQ
jgi:O-methyltransferase domain/Dimerisation domain